MKAAAGLSDRDQAFDVQFELTKNLSDTPHYCTKDELIDTLTKRFGEVCGDAEKNPGGPGCGHANLDDFVDFWKKNVVAAGLIEATTATAMRAAKQAGKAASSAYATNMYNKAREVIDVSQSDHLRNVLGKRVLWMDSPANNRLEANLLRALGMEIGCSAAPKDAIEQLLKARKPLSQLFPGAGKYALDGRVCHLLVQVLLGRGHLARQAEEHRAGHEKTQGTPS